MLDLRTRSTTPEENAMKTLKRLVLVGLVGAAVAAVAQRLQAGGEQQWQSAEPRP